MKFIRFLTCAPNDAVEAMQFLCIIATLMFCAAVLAEDLPLAEVVDLDVIKPRMIVSYNGTRPVYQDVKCESGRT